MRAGHDFVPSVRSSVSLARNFRYAGWLGVINMEPTWAGRVVSIHIAGEAQGRPQSVDAVRAVPGRGLEGDRYYMARGTYSGQPGSGREITFIESEAIQAMARDQEIPLSAGDARRNVVTHGVPLNHLVGRDFLVGDVKMRGVRLCEPCAHLEGLTRRGVLG